MKKHLQTSASGYKDIHQNTRQEIVQIYHHKSLSNAPISALRNKKGLLRRKKQGSMRPAF